MGLWADYPWHYRLVNQIGLGEMLQLEKVWQDSDQRYIDMLLVRRIVCRVVIDVQSICWHDEDEETSCYSKQSKVHHGCLRPTITTSVTSLQAFETGLCISVP